MQVPAARPPPSINIKGKDDSTVPKPAIDRYLFEVPLPVHAKQNIASLRKRTQQAQETGFVELIDVSVKQDDNACTWVTSTYAIVTGFCIR